MLQRTRFHALSVLPCLAFSLLAQTPAQETLAKPVQIAPHQSRWDYPKEVTLPPNTMLHQVEKGDTLWDLGTKYLGNAFAWPQIWELNKWVADPHWIYPGDFLIVDGTRTSLPQSPTETAGMSPDEVAELQPDVKRTAPRRPRDEYGYSMQDFVQMPFMVQPGVAAYLKKTGALKIVGKQDGIKDLQGDGDVVYLNGGSDQGFKPGDRLVTFVVAESKFYHPEDQHHRKPMGDILQQSGILRITRAYPRESIAIVERCMSSIQIGDYANIFAEPANVLTSLRTDLPEQIEVKASAAKIIYLHEGKVLAGSGEMLIIDRGANEGLKVGDTLIIARKTSLDPTRKATAKDFVHSYVGQLMVIRADDRTSTCRILRNRIEVQVGDEVTP